MEFTCWGKAYVTPLATHLCVAPHTIPSNPLVRYSIYGVGQICWNVYICRLHCALTNRGIHGGSTYSYLYLFAVTIFIALGAHMCLHSDVRRTYFCGNYSRKCLTVLCRPPQLLTAISASHRMDFVFVVVFVFGGWQLTSWILGFGIGMVRWYMYAIWLAARLRGLGMPRMACQGHKLSPTPRLPASVRAH